ncbi:MAG: hypothetical protein HY324_03800 [Chlamydiia bacterium]|nr:hypothetical protein [Chlamydiia bacterium]
MFMRTEGCGFASHSVRNEPCTERAISIALVLGLGGLAIAGVGLSGCLQVGSLSSLGQVNSIIMMAAGGGGGIVFLIAGIIGSVKNRQKSRNIEYEKTTFIEVTSQGLIRDAQRFGKAEWKNHFGNIGEEPPLPRNIEEILNSPCPFSEDKSVKVKDTHMLVLVPATINEESVTLDMLQEFFETNYPAYDGFLLQGEHGATAVGKSHWVLMTKAVIPESRNKSYNDQKAMLKGTDYVLPQAVEAVVCILAEFIISKTHLYNMTYTRCAETVEGQYPVIVGNFFHKGLSVGHSRSSSGYDDEGIACTLQME